MPEVIRKEKESHEYKHEQYICLERRAGKDGIGGTENVKKQTGIGPLFKPSKVWNKNYNGAY